jgi:hypothetical protein
MMIFGMKKSPLGFLLSCSLAAVLAGCGGSGSGLPIAQNSGPPAAATLSAGVDARSVTQAVTTAATPLPAGTYWSGTVSGVGSNGINANCGQSNFAQGYGCLPVSTAGAKVTGSPVVGQYFQMWGDLSHLPNITATTINYGPTQFPTVAPTAGPTAAPTSNATATPAGMPAGAPSWTGTVSNVGSNWFTANCGQSNFAQGYGCIPVTLATGAKLVGTEAVGAYFELWGTVSPPNVTATYVLFSATPFTSPTPSGGATSTPSPKPSTAATPANTPPPSGSTFMGFANAQDWPVSFTPYASNSPFNTRVSVNPTFLANSAAIVAAQFPNGTNDGNIRANEAGQYDYAHARFFAKASDPVVALHCSQYCGAPDNGGIPATIHIPAVARPARGGDAHLDVVQPDGTDITMWGANSPGGNWTTGATVTAANIANCGSFASGQGWLPSGPGPTAVGYCTNAGIVTAAELAAGQINHAVIITGECAVGSQYPVERGGTTGQCTSGVGPPLGGREWYDVPCATTQANGALHPWEKALLCALNQYGGYMGDNGNGGVHFTGGVNPGVESEEAWYDFFGPGYTSPFAVLASQGWYSITIANAIGSASGTRWFGADPWRPSGVNFPAHIHWLAPCSAQGSC